MNEQLETALVDLLSTVKDVKEFTLEQAPEVLQQLITFHLWANIVWLIICVALMIAAIPIGRRCIEENSKPLLKRREPFELAIPMFGGVFLGVFVIPFACCIIYEILHITIAPKLYIIEYIAKIL